MERKHYIMMGGIRGCMPSHCDAYESLESAIDSAVELYDALDQEYTAIIDDVLSDNEGIIDDIRDSLREYKYVDLEGYELYVDNEVIQYESIAEWLDNPISGNHVFGNEYVSIDECDCAEPWIHSEDGDPEYWEEYPEFQVNEYSTGYEIEHLVTGKTHWLSDGVDFHNSLLFSEAYEDENGNLVRDAIPDVGTEAFRTLWQESFNADKESTREAYGFSE